MTWQFPNLFTCIIPSDITALSSCTVQYLVGDTKDVIIKILTVKLSHILKIASHMLVISIYKFFRLRVIGLFGVSLFSRVGGYSIIVKIDS